MWIPGGEMRKRGGIRKKGGVAWAGKAAGLHATHQRVLKPRRVRNQRVGCCRSPGLLETNQRDLSLRTLFRRPVLAHFSDRARLPMHQAAPATPPRHRHDPFDPVHHIPPVGTRGTLSAFEIPVLDQLM